MQKSKTFQLVESRYTVDGKPLKLSKSQELIFNCIFKRKAPDGRRNIHCATYTRFGKSLTAGLALLTRVTTYPEKWAIVAPDQAKAKIIMGYVIDHIFDNDFTRAAFKISKGEDLERIRRERSKSRLTFRVGDNIGEVFILSAQEKRNKNPLDALMGFGASNIIIDESSLIDDVKHAGILRMLGDSADPFIFEIGNPFRRNHFYYDSTYAENINKNYYHVLVSYKKGLKEGRITQEQIDRMIDKPYFDIMYGCKFPPGDMMDAHGWMPLLTHDEIQQARKRKVQSIGPERVGCDIAEGGDANAIVGRTTNYARLLHRDHERDLMTTTGTIGGLVDENRVNPKNVMVDAIGDGAGVVSRLREKHYYVWGVKNSETAESKDKFANRKAENYWRLREWIRHGGCLEDIDAFDELRHIKYRYVGSEGKIELMSKRELLSNGVKSPNVADGLAMTFYRHIPHNLGQANREKPRLVGGYGGKVE